MVFGAYGCKVGVMKTIAALLLVSASIANAASYPYMIVNYDYSRLGGVTSLNVRLHNNGQQRANCEVTVFNRSESTTIEPMGNAIVSFSSLPEGAQPGYACSSR